MVWGGMEMAYTAYVYLVQSNLTEVAEITFYIFLVLHALQAIGKGASLQTDRPVPQI